MTQTLKLGATGPAVFPIGLGCMGMSDMYGAADDAESVRTIHAAIDAGVSLIDTGDFYGMGHNEMLIARAIEGRRDRVQISVKFGALRAPNGMWSGVDTRPAAVKNFVAYSLKRLRIEAIDVYRPARLDPNVPIEETVGAIADLVKQGYVKHIGLSEVGAETIRRAHAVHPIIDVQLEYAVATRGPEDKIFPVLHELGISATLYGVYSRGLLTGSKPNGASDYRKYLPRFTGERGAHNASAIDALRAFAEARSLTSAQVLVGWVLAKEPGFLPILGARKVSQLTDALRALERPLTGDDVTELERLFPAGSVLGDRYATEQMKHLDSER